MPAAQSRRIFMVILPGTEVNPQTSGTPRSLRIVRPTMVNFL